MSFRRRPTGSNRVLAVSRLTPSEFSLTSALRYPLFYLHALHQRFSAERPWSGFLPAIHSLRTTSFHASDQSRFELDLGALLECVFLIAIALTSVRLILEGDPVQSQVSLLLSSRTNRARMGQDPPHGRSASLSVLGARNTKGFRTRTSLLGSRTNGEGHRGMFRGLIFVSTIRLSADVKSANIIIFYP